MWLCNCFRRSAMIKQLTPPRDIVTRSRTPLKLTANQTRNLANGAGDSHHPPPNFQALVGKERLLSEYSHAKSFLAMKKLPDDVNPYGIFANDEVYLEDIDVYGYDYDYTLAAYRKTTVENLLHTLAKQSLVSDCKYPEAMLKFEYDPNFSIRGVHYDVLRGLLIKINSVLQIQTDAVFRGRQKLTRDEVLSVYRRKELAMSDIEQTITIHGHSFVHLVDNFAKPMVCLLADVIQWFVENGIDYEPESIYTDVKASIDKAHPLFHMAAANDPKMILEQDPELRPMLERLKSNGKTTFLMTNSPFEIVNAGMNFMLGDDWRSLFDVVIVSAKKPTFFTAENRHFREYSLKRHRLKWSKVTSIEPGQVYSGGNFQSLEAMTGWKPNRVLYFGDHPYADLADLSTIHGWRTCAIIEELEEEIAKGNDPQMKYNVNWTNMLQALLETHQDSADDPDCQEIIASWKSELQELRDDMKNHYNEQFGSVFRSKRNPTFFSRRLFRVSDVYTSRVTNFNQYSLTHTFYPRRGVLPHEFRSWFV